MIKEGDLSVLVKKTEKTGIRRTINIKKASVDTLELRFDYEPSLVAAVKDNFEGRRWNPEKKLWTIKNCQRNEFYLRMMTGEKVYSNWDQPVQPHTSALFERLKETPKPPMPHQQDLFNSAVTYKHHMWAAEMGTGKTLVYLALLQHFLQYENAWYIGVKSSIRALQIEARVWSQYAPLRKFNRILTYDGLKSVIAEWKSGQKSPNFLIFDEFSCAKTPTSQRSRVAQHLADSVRDEHGLNSIIIGGTGTPAPKDPVDWWKQCEIICPGFLKEGHPDTFKRQLALIKDTQTLTGATFPKLITWWDDERKCAECGQIHEEVADDLHKFKPSKNEVGRIYNRLKGLVTVMLKKDVMKFLPERMERIIDLTPTPESLRAAKLLANGATSAIGLMIKLRMLSDGFQYVQEATGEMEDCCVCNGKGLIEEWYTKSGDIFSMESLLLEAGEKNLDPTDLSLECQKFQSSMIGCYNCENGKVEKFDRGVKEFPTPKDEAFLDLLEEFEDTGRFVVFAVFDAVIEKLQRLCQKAGWQYIVFDGKSIRNSWDCEGDCLAVFQMLDAGPSKICFIGHPKPAGMGLTLTKSCAALFYDNDLEGQSKQQASDRIHRPGMDLNKGATIMEFNHMPIDRLIIEGHKNKQVLQKLTLGQIRKGIGVDENTM
jgi:hypothetical protein